jgi:hypothetical protein
MERTKVTKPRQPVRYVFFCSVSRISADLSFCCFKQISPIEQEEHTEEPVPTVVTSTEPVVGQKRPREDDDAGQQSHQHKTPSPTLRDEKHSGRTDQTLPQQIGTSIRNTPPASTPSNVNMNQYGGGPMNGMHTTTPTQMGVGGTHDALYIGDLQWVR